MTKGQKVAFVIACVACCLPLLLAIAGVTTGAAGAVGYWFGDNEAFIEIAIGLAYLTVVFVRHFRAKASNTKKLADPTRRPR